MGRIFPLHFFFTFRGMVLLALSYGVLHSAMRLGASWNLGENDPVTVLQAQSLIHLLGSSEGVIFDLFYYGLSMTFGENAFTFQWLRYGFLTLALSFVFLITRRISQDGYWALITVESYALVYQLSWRMHEGFTYLLVTMVMVAATFWCFCCLLEHWSRPRYLLFMSCVLAGASTDIWFGAFLASFILALFVRRDVPHWFALQSALIVGLFVSAIDLFALGFGFNRVVFVEDALSGLVEAGLLILAASSPFLAIVLLFFGWRYPQRSGHQNIAIAMIQWITLFSCMGLLSVGLLLQVNYFGEQEVLPLFMLYPIWVMDMVRRTAPKDWQVLGFAGLCLLLMVAAFIARAANLYVMDPVCKRCYFGVPYQALSERLAQNYKTAPLDEVVTPDLRLSGQLAAFWPGERPWFDVRLSSNVDKNRGSNSGGSGEIRQVLVLWNKVRGDGRARQILAEAGLTDNTIDAALGRAEAVSIGWRHWWRPTGYRQTTWKVTTVEY